MFLYSDLLQGGLQLLLLRSTRPPATFAWPKPMQARMKPPAPLQNAGAASARTTFALWKMAGGNGTTCNAASAGTALSAEEVIVR